MKKKMARIFTLVLSLALLVSVCVLSFPALAGSGAESTGTDITGVKFSTIGAGANELKIFCTVEPATLTTGNYWEGTIKEVITQEELDAFTTKIRINDKTLKEWMDTGYIRYLPDTSAGQLDIVFKNSGDFLNLSFNIGYILCRRLFRVNTHLNCIVFCRKTECIPAHWMDNIVSV